MTRIQRLTLATVVLVVVAAVAVVAFMALRGPGRSVAASTSGYADQPTLGDADAPVKIFLFENFLCEHCRAFEENAFPRLVRDYIDPGLVEAYYVNLARGVDGLEPVALRSCVIEERYAGEVQRDLDLAERVGVEGTPSVIVGDEGFQAPAYPRLAAAIDARLEVR